MSVSRVTVFLSAQQLSKVSYSSLKMTEPDQAALIEYRAFKLKVRLGSMVYEGWLGSVRCSIFRAKSLARFDQPRADLEPNRAARDRLPSLIQTPWTTIALAVDCMTGSNEWGRV